MSTSSSTMADGPPVRERVRIGEIWIDRLTFDAALDAVEELVAAGSGGRVFTPNVDHLVLAETNAAFKAAYSQASLSLVDGQPLVWTSRIMGVALPGKISGADLIRPLMRRAAERNWRVYLLGGAPGVGAKAADVLRRESGVNIVGVACPRIAADGTCDASVLADVRAAEPELLLAALGSPKQEIWIHRNAPGLGSVVAVGIGAGLDFIAGTAARAPGWVSELGLEWMFRLAHEPGRLWRRYLLDDARFPLIVWRTLRRPQHERHVAVERPITAAAAGEKSDP